jgi:DNA anti-recombination protein RmuC
LDSLDVENATSESECIEIAGKEKWNHVCIKRLNAELNAAENKLKKLRKENNFSAMHLRAFELHPKFEQVDELFQNLATQLQSINKEYLEFYECVANTIGNAPRTFKEIVDHAVSQYLGHLANKIEWLNPQHRWSLTEYVENYLPTKKIEESIKAAACAADREIAQDEARMKAELSKYGDLSDIQVVIDEY